jgi:uncharacterized repeat protein (TIGR01451 family)
MKHILRFFMASLLVLVGLGVMFQFSSSAPLTQSVPWFTVNSGGGRSSGGNMEVMGTMGQYDAGMMSGGLFQVSGGFWQRAHTLGLAADVAVAKSVNVAQAAPGEMITYTITFGNDGTAVATGITLTDVLPAGLVNPTAISSGATITPVVGLDYQWQVADLAPGTGGTITITATVDPALSTNTTILNTAVISAAADSNNANNSDNASFLAMVIPNGSVYTLYLPAIYRDSTGD